MRRPFTKPVESDSAASVRTGEVYIEEYYQQSVSGSLEMSWSNMTIDPDAVEAFYINVLESSYANSDINAEVSVGDGGTSAENRKFWAPGTAASDFDFTQPIPIDLDTESPHVYVEDPGGGSFTVNVSVVYR